MTIFIDKPLFTCKERDNLDPVWVEDVLSFIHLVRLNLPVVLLGSPNDTDSKFFEENGGCVWRSSDCKYVPCKELWEYDPKNSHISHREYYKTIYSPKGPVRIDYKHRYFCLPSDWNALLDALKEGNYKAPDMSDPPPFKGIKKTEEGNWEIEGFPFPIHHKTELVKIIAQKAWAYAPSPKFKSRAESVHSAKDLPFEVV